MNDDRAAAVMDPPKPGRPPRPAVPAATRFALDNGLRVIAVSRRDLPQIAARLVVPAGSILDRGGARGTASLVAALMTEGTATRSAVELNEQIDALGAAIGVRAGHDFAEAELSLLAETLPQGLELFSEVVIDPAFPDREVERLRAEALDALDARLDEPGNVADDRAAEAVFGPDHPYGRHSLGTRQGVAGIRREDLIDFHGRHYRPDGSFLVVAGDFAMSELRRHLERTLRRWSGTAPRPSLPPSPPRPREAGALSFLAREHAAQGEVRLAGVGIPRRHPDWIPAAVANYILGGSTITGRLGANLREEKGWTYGVRSGFASGLEAAGWAVETAVDARVSRDAIAEIEHEIGRIIAEPVEQEELARARDAMVLSLPRAFETPRRIVARLSTVEAFGLGEDYWRSYPERIEAVDAADILRVAAAHFDPRKLTRVVVAPAED